MDGWIDISTLSSIGEGGEARARRTGQGCDGGDGAINRCDDGVEVEV